MNMQADLNLRCAHTSEGTFFVVAAHFFFFFFFLILLFLLKLILVFHNYEIMT